eukprot:SAG31_NODE_2610_length_5382_cov_5.371948_2_plen_399_part_00
MNENDTTAPVVADNFAARHQKAGAMFVFGGAKTNFEAEQRLSQLVAGLGQPINPPSAEEDGYDESREDDGVAIAPVSSELNAALPTGQTGCHKSFPFTSDTKTAATELAGGEDEVGKPTPMRTDSVAAASPASAKPISSSQIQIGSKLAAAASSPAAAATKPDQSAFVTNKQQQTQRQLEQYQSALETWVQIAQREERQRRELENQLQQHKASEHGNSVVASHQSAGAAAELHQKTTAISQLQQQLANAKGAAEQQLAALKDELTQERRQSAHLSAEIERLTPVKKRKHTEDDTAAAPADSSAMVVVDAEPGAIDSQHPSCADAPTESPAKRHKPMDVERLDTLSAEVAELKRLFMQQAAAAKHQPPVRLKTTMHAVQWACKATFKLRICGIAVVSFI